MEENKQYSGMRDTEPKGDESYSQKGEFARRTVDFCLVIPAESLSIVQEDLSKVPFLIRIRLEKLLGLILYLFKRPQE